MKILVALSIISSVALGSDLPPQVQACSQFMGLSRFTSNVVKATPGEISTEEMKAKLGANRTLNYTALETLNGERFNENDLFTDKSDFILAIDTLGNTHGHTYLVINGLEEGGVRFDGRMFFAPSTYTKAGWTISKGLIIRYKNIPPENKRKLVDWLKKEEILKTPTCVVAACKVLFERADFQGPDKRFWFPSTLLKFLGRNGMVGLNKTQVSPEIYTINSDINIFWNDLPSWRTVPRFIFKVLFDPYTWKGTKR